MNYDPEMVRPMREELVKAGVKELRTPAEVDAFLDDKNGSALVIVNSVCGCAAGAARPGVRSALQHDVKPDRVATVFAGVDREATDRARSRFAGMPPSSPSMALFKDGELVDFVPRHKIEGRDAMTFANELKVMFNKHLGA